MTGVAEHMLAAAAAATAEAPGLQGTVGGSGWDKGGPAFADQVATQIVAVIVAVVEAVAGVAVDS